MDVLRFESVSFSYESEASLIEDISFSLDKGTTTALVGLSGSGKTTICYLACGIIPRVYDGTVKGKVMLFGEELPSMHPERIAGKVGIVFQNPETQLFLPYVEDELAFGPENLCLEPREIEHRILSAMEDVGIESLRGERTNTLSGGQKQMVAIASVLTLQPDILIFDEIMSQLDQKSKTKIRVLIRRLQQQGKTILMVEHDFENLKLADRVLLLDGKGLRVTDGEVVL